MIKKIFFAAVMLIIPVLVISAGAENMSLGVTLYDGAQVRLGKESVTDGKISSEDSGIRFIAEVDRSDTLAGLEGAEIGIAVSTEGSDRWVHIPAQSYQQDDSVFSAAIVNIKEENFNRMFEAKPYVLLDGVYHYGESVKRSPYQVASGLLNNGSGSAYLFEVLNAYVNQTGIRLSFADTCSGDAFVPAQTTGEPFFTVESVEYSLGKYCVTLKTTGKAVIHDYWQEKIRVNNNNSTASQMMKDTKLEGDTLVFTFDLEKYVFDQSESVMIVGSFENGTITGFRDGESVSYAISEKVDVIGLSDKIEDITPGTVILPALTKTGECGAVEILALPGDKMAEHYGVYDAADGSGVYQNVISRYYSKSGTTLRVTFPPESAIVKYGFESGASKYYSISSADGQTTIKQYRIADSTGFPKAAENNVYIYLRYDSERNVVTEGVVFSTPKDTDPGTDDGEYSPIYKLEKIN